MNANPKAIRVLCYGDSNTWGQIPVTKARYPADVRWTGILQKMLGESYEIIEEGLSSRSTRWEYRDKEGRNGLQYLPPCLESHNPIDIVVLFLGTNDLKNEYHQTAETIAESIAQLIHVIKEKAWTTEKESPKIILVSPPMVDNSVESTHPKYDGAQEKSEMLGNAYARIANLEECEFIDLAQSVSPSKLDGIHLEPEAHVLTATLLQKKIIDL